LLLLQFSSYALFAGWDVPALIKVQGSLKDSTASLRRPTQQEKVVEKLEWQVVSSRGKDEEKDSTIASLNFCNAEGRWLSASVEFGG